MSANLPSLYGQQFATVVQLLLQQKGSRLRPFVMTGSHKGEQASPVDQIGSVEMNEVTTRFEPIVRTDAAVDRRWVSPTSFDLAQQVDSFDELKVLSDPKSKYAENAVAAAGRKIDAVIMAAARGTNYTGKSGTTATVLPAANKIAVGFGAAGSVGLTVKKLKEIRRLFMSYNVDLDQEEIHMAISATQHDNLLDEIQVISSDFNGGRPVMQDGKVVRFLGINFHQTQLNPAVSSVRYCPVWVKSGMHLGLWADVQTDVSQRKDLKGLPWQVYLKLTVGATRLEENKVLEVACAE